MNAETQPDNVIPITQIQLYTIKETMAFLRMSRTVIYEEFHAGRLEYVTRGRSRRVRATAIADYIARLPRGGRKAA